jgi:hypothetical protein
MLVIIYSMLFPYVTKTSWSLTLKGYFKNSLYNLLVCLDAIYGWEVITFEVCYSIFVNLCLYWHMEKWIVGVFQNISLLAIHKSLCEQYFCGWCNKNSLTDVGVAGTEYSGLPFLPKLHLFYYNCQRSKIYFKVGSTKIVAYWEYDAL